MEDPHETDQEATKTHEVGVLASFSFTLSMPPVTLTFWTFTQGLIFTTKFAPWKIESKALGFCPFIFKSRILDQEMDTVAQSRLAHSYRNTWQFTRCEIQKLMLCV